MNRGDVPGGLAENVSVTPPGVSGSDPGGGSVSGSAGPHGVAALLHGIVTERVAPGASGDGSQVLDQRLARLREKLDLVLEEHEGMGNELLHAYEQLGVVFDITRRLASATDEHEVMTVVTESLRAMFADCHFTVMRRDSDGELRISSWDVANEAPDESLCLYELVEGSVSARRVTVRSIGNAEEESPDDSEECRTGSSQVMVCPVHAGDEFACALVLIRGESSPRFTSADMQLMDSLRVFCGDIIRNLRLVYELRQVSIDMVRALVGTIDQKDMYTSGHSDRVGFYSCLLARQLGWSDERLQTLEWAALLHDVGKIGIRDDVLKKAGKLTADEFEHMKEHPVRSSDVVCRVPQLAEAIDGVLHHHEHWDGSGYPDGLAGEAIPLQARIIQIADIFDALTTCRSYRQAFSWQKALEILSDEAGTVVDPELAKVFDKLICDWAARDPVGLERRFAESSGCDGEEGQGGGRGAEQSAAYGTYVAEAAAVSSQVDGGGE
ncbi:MAG: HD-GYP domain-containing protein [bacterium]|nr:HD-GYP domain-containing protein [bacterium]